MMNKTGKTSSTDRKYFPLKFIIVTLIASINMSFFLAEAKIKIVPEKYFVCSPKKTVKENSSYLDQITAEMNKESEVIMNFKMEEAKQIPLLVNYFKKVLCYREILGGLEYTEELQKIELKAKQDLRFQKTYEKARDELTLGEAKKLQEDLDTLERSQQYRPDNN